MPDSATDPADKSPATHDEHSKTAAAASAARSVGRGIRTVLLIAVTVFATVFLLANSKSVEVNYLFGSAETPLFVALAVALILGALITLMAVGLRKMRRGHH